MLKNKINIADIAKEEISKAYSFIKFCAKNGSVSVKEMWNIMKNIWPKNQESIPTGKLNHIGKLVTGPQEIKTLFYKEYKERLRPRPTHPNLSHLNEIKNKSFEAKLKEAKKNKSPDWTMSELDIVLKDIDKKSPIRETKHLSTDADSCTDTIVWWTKNTPNPIFLKNGKNHQKHKNSKTFRNMTKLAIHPLTRGL